MVTTNSPKTELSFKVSDLLKSSFAEDREIAELAIQRMDELIRKLVPVLPYVTRPFSQHGIKVVMVGQFETPLMINEDGKWYRMDYLGGRGGYPLQGHDCWHYYNFASVLQGLEEVFAAATLKKEAHLASVQKHRDTLSKIGDIIRDNGDGSNKK